jgi:hypothetical protein
MVQKIENEIILINYKKSTHQSKHSILPKFFYFILDFIMLMY